MSQIKKIDFQKEFEKNFNGELLFNATKYINELKNRVGKENFSKIKKQKDFIGDGNSVAVNVLKRLVTGLVGYPITPSTPIAEGMAQAYADGFVNVFGEKIFYFQPESELGAIAFLEGAASQGGRFADNTSSQGLTYKTKNMYSVAGKRLPVVMTVQCRELNKGSISIHNGHADLYAARGTGWILLMSSNNQEFHHLIPAAFKTIEQRQIMLPAIVGGEGFLKSHSIENIKIVSDEFLKYFVGPPNRLYQPDFENPVLTGPFTDINATMPTQVKQDYALKNVKKYFKAVFNIINKLLNTNLQVVENYKTEGSEYIIVCMGAGAETVKEIVDYYRSKGFPVGLVRPVLFYPPCIEEIAYGIQHAKKISVLEKVASANETYLFNDVKKACTLLNIAPDISHGVYGLGSQNFSPEDVMAVIENMKSKKSKNSFYLNITGPDCLAPVYDKNFQENEIGITFIGVGAEGVKTSQETIAKIIAKSGKFVQTSAKYGASRKGGMVVMNARISEKPIRNCSNLEKVDILAIFNDKYLLDNTLFNFIAGIKKGGYLIINTAKSLKEIINTTSPEIKSILKKLPFNIVLIDATHAVLEKLKRNLPGTPILGVINKLMEILPEKEFLKIFKQELEEKFGRKKKEVIDINLSLLNVPFEMAKSDYKIEKININYKDSKKLEKKKKEIYFKLPRYKYSEKDELATPIFPNLYGKKYYDKFIKEVLIPYQKGEFASWDNFPNIVPARTSVHNTTSLIGTSLPVFNPEKCINCGMCVLACPDNALRVTILNESEIKKLPKKEQNLFQKLNVKRFTGKEQDLGDTYYFNINVIEKYCKGCGGCRTACKFDALKMMDKDEIFKSKKTLFINESIFKKDQSENIYSYVNYSKYPQRIMLRYSGQKHLPGGHSLCPGCGEGIIENITFTAAEMVKRNPKQIKDFYKNVPNLLKRKHGKGLEHILKNGFNIYTINATGCAEVSCLANPFNSRIYNAGHYGFGTASAAALGARISLFSAFRNYYLDKLTKVIVLGGDGAFYDIGNQGLNFALGEIQDITWVIYNNEAYMNTGFQKSGASRYGTSRSTSPYGLKIKGKDDFQRELVEQAMAIPGVYVARLSISNPIFALKILKEAIGYKGPSLIEFFSPCPTGQGLPTDDMSFKIANMMVESRAWPILVRKPYNGIDITANPDYTKLFPESKNKKYATFKDIVETMGQFKGNEEEIKRIIMVNEKQNIYRWMWLQHRAGVRDNLLTEEEIEDIIAKRYNF